MTVSKYYDQDYLLREANSTLAILMTGDRKQLFLVFTDSASPKSRYISTLWSLPKLAAQLTFLPLTQTMILDLDHLSYFFPS